MKKLLIAIPLFALVVTLISSCMNQESTWEEYETWRNENLTYLQEQQGLLDSNGKPYYQALVADWNPASYILIHYYNDREKTKGNLTPLFTSTVKTWYHGSLCTGVGFDSSFTYVDSVITTSPSQVIEGWAIALSDMRVGDSCRIIIPYQSGYGSTASGKIPPYSTLKFEMALRDVVTYEVKP